MPALGCHKGYLCGGERYTCIKLHDCCCSISLTGGCVFVILIGLLLVCWSWHAGLSVCVYIYRSPGHSRFHRQPTPSQPRTFLCACSACRWLHFLYANRVSGQTSNLMRFRLQGTLNCQPNLLSSARSTIIVYMPLVYVEQHTYHRPYHKQM